jgi:hypothetical protein
VADEQQQLHAGNAPVHDVDGNTNLISATTGPVVTCPQRPRRGASKSVGGTEVAAVMYTLVESANASSIDPMAYLIECATRAKRTPGTVLLPADFKAEFAQ